MGALIPAATIPPLGTEGWHGRDTRGLRLSPVRPFTLFLIGTGKAYREGTPYAGCAVDRNGTVYQFDEAATTSPGTAGLTIDTYLRVPSSTQVSATAVTSKECRMSRVMR
jgi:hypothetical protein